MGLSSALGIGRSALLAYQAALQVVGNNIANVGTPGYTRNSADLSAIQGTSTGFGQLGRGVRLAAVRRNINESLQGRLRSAMADKESAGAQQASMNLIEGVFNPLGEINLGSLLNDFFRVWGDLQNNPDNVATRGMVVTTAQALVARIRDIRGDLVNLRSDLNTQIDDAVKQVNDLATRIAELNGKITVAEAGGGGPASSLRDQRDQLLGELSEILEITVREQPSGAVNVYVGNEALIEFGQAHGLHTSSELDANGLSNAVVRFDHNNGQIQPPSGLIEGLLTARDTHITTRLSRLDALVGALIREVNNIHGSGKGLSAFSSMTSLNTVLDPALALSDTSNGLAFISQTGSFFVDVKDTATGAVVRTQINIDLDGLGGNDSTLNSVAADITANVANVTATVLTDGRLQLDAASGHEFTFADDTSGFLASMGLNAFFGGKDSLTIEVNPAVAADPSLVAASQSGLSGDGSNATAMAALQDLALTSLGGVSLSEHYTTTMAELAVTSSSVQNTVDASTIIFESLTVQRESISGVNLDEEAVAMITYQRAYEGAARYMTVVNDMLQTLIGLIR